MTLTLTLNLIAGAFLTEFREYNDGSIVFEQRFPDGTDGTAVNRSHPMGGRDDVSSSFPSFQTHGCNHDLGYLAYAGDMTGSKYVYGNNQHADRLISIMLSMLPNPNPWQRVQVRGWKVSLPE